MKGRIAGAGVKGSVTGQPDRRTSSPALWTGLVVVLSVALYVVLATVQRAIVRDGGMGSSTPAASSVVGADLASYYVATVALMAAYAAIVTLCVRGQLPRVGKAAVLAAPILIELGLLGVPPSFSTDVLSYAGHGGLGLAVPGATPYTDPARLVGTALGDGLTALGWRVPLVPSPYGPLWARIEQTIALLSAGLGVQVLAFRLLEVAAVAISGALVWKIIERVRPGDAFVGTALYLWNPVVIAELPGEGHNDGAMVMFVLLGLWATLQVRAGPSFVATGAGVLVKYVPLVLMPPQIVYLWRIVADRRRLLLELAIGTGIVAIFTIALIAPIWTPHMFDGLRRQGTPQPWPTLGGAVLALLARFQVDGAAAVSAMTALAFASFVIWVSSRVRDPEGLLRAILAIAGTYALAASAIFYPWYVALPIALACLIPRREFIALILVLSTVSRFIAPLVDMRPEYYPFVEAWIVMTYAGVLVSLVALVLALTPAGAVAARIAKRLLPAQVHCS